MADFVPPDGRRSAAGISEPAQPQPHSPEPGSDTAGDRQGSGALAEPAPRDEPSDRSFDRPRQAYAAIDLGTNNCRLLIARPAERNFVVIDAFSRVVRLGEGLAQTGRL